MTRTTGNVALGGYFNDAFYLELLRTAHVLAVQAGVSLTGGESMGLGGQIRSRDGVRVPEESAALDAKANEFLAQFGLTREATISLLTNQLGVTQEELVYAWDIPTYTVMRGGKQQAPQAPEFFSANPLGGFDNQAWGTEVSESATVEGGDPRHGSAYRPNNTMMYRQGSNLAPKAEEIYGRGGDPRHAGVQMREQDDVYELISPTGSENLADLYPHGYGVNYEDDLFVPNTPLGWALEATVGAMFGPTGRALMRAGGGRLFAMMARNLDTLPPELLVKFRQLSEIFDPKLKDARRADALAETAARDRRVAEVIEPDHEELGGVPGRRLTDEEWEYHYEEAQIARNERRAADRRPEGGWSSEEMGGDSVAPLTRAESLVHALDSYEGMFSSPDDGTRLFQEFTEHPDRYGDTRPGWDPLADPPEIVYATERGNLTASELTDDELAEAIHSQTALGEQREQSGFDFDPESSDFQSGTELYNEVWRRFASADTVDSRIGANPARVNLNQITPSEMATIPPDLLPPDVSPYPARRGVLPNDAADLREGPYRFRPELEGSDRFEPLSPYDLSEEALDFLGVTHVDGVPRPSAAQRAAHPPGYYPPSIHPGARSSAYRPDSPSDLQREVERIRSAERQTAQDESWYQHQQDQDLPDPLGEQVPPDTGARPGELLRSDGKPTGAWDFPEGMDRTQSMLDNWDPIEELKVWTDDYGHATIRIGDVEFTLTSSHSQMGEVHITWGHPGVEVADTTMGRAETGTRDALRELERIVEYLSANGVRLSASVDPGQARLVDAYRRMGFTISDGLGVEVPFMPRFTKAEAPGQPGGELFANELRYRSVPSGGGIFQISLDPEAKFLEAAIEGQSRAPLGLPFGGEEEWAGNAYALGKINQYSDEDIAHFYVLEAMEEYKPGIADPFWEHPPGLHPDARGINLQDMRNVPEDVLTAAYTKFRADRADTGFGYTGPGGFRKIPAADREIIPAPGMEDTFAAFQRTVADAVPEVQDAVERFVGAAEFRPKHTVHAYSYGEGAGYDLAGDLPGDIRISDIMRHKGMDGYTRDIVVVELGDGTMQPFYLRSGGGNAPGDEAILAEGGGGGAHMWVPFDGFGQYGQDRHWLRKSRFTEGIEKTDPLYRYGTAELKDVGDKLDQYFLSLEGTLDPDASWRMRPPPEIVGTGRADDFYRTIPLADRTPEQWTTPRRLAAWEMRQEGVTYREIGEAFRFSPERARTVVADAERDFAYRDEYLAAMDDPQTAAYMDEQTSGIPEEVSDDLGEEISWEEKEALGRENWRATDHEIERPRVFEYTEVTPNDMRAGYEGFFAPAEANELLGTLSMDDYSAKLGTSTHGALGADRDVPAGWVKAGPDDDISDAIHNYNYVTSEDEYFIPPYGVDAEAPFSPMIHMDPDDWSWPNQFGKGITGSAYGVAGLGAMNATDFLTPLLSRETTFEEALTGTAPAIQPVQSMLAWQANNNEGWWSWIKDYPDHLEWMAKATAATMDALEKTSRSTNDQVLDGLGDGFREQAHGLTTQLGGGAVPLVGREDPELLKGVSRDLSQRGHNGHQIFSNDTRKEIENGDAMIVGYRSDADYQRAVGAAGRYGVVIDGNYWRRPSDNSLKPREGEEWTREHLQKMATSGYFGGAK